LELNDERSEIRNVEEGPERRVSALSFASKALWLHVLESLRVLLARELTQKQAQDLAAKAAAAKKAVEEAQAGQLSTVPIRVISDLS